jgi:cyclophilin family peptidyl-prolyl cis-trans isomerase
MRLPFLTVLALLAGDTAFAANPYDLPDGLYTEITTEHGVVVGELFYKKVPMTVANHVGLAEGTLGPAPRKPFYDGLTWCRVVPGFVLQGGDPTNTGNGDAGYFFPDEIVPGLRHEGMGILQMANDGPDTNGSQFCLMLSEEHRLNYQHSVFGRVVRGLDVLPQVRQGDTMRVKILRLGEAARAFRADEENFAALVNKAGRYSGPREPGADAPFDDPDRLLPTDWDRAKNFNYKLVNFERFTGTRLAVRQHAKAPEADLDGWLIKEAARLKVNQQGALAVYLAEQDRWHIRIGGESAEKFCQSGPNGEKAPPATTVEVAVNELLNTAAKRSGDGIAKTAARLEPGEAMTDARRLKIRVDSVVDALIFKLE